MIEKFFLKRNSASLFYNSTESKESTSIEEPVLLPTVIVEVSASKDTLSVFPTVIVIEPPFITN